MCDRGSFSARASGEAICELKFHADRAFLKHLPVTVTRGHLMELAGYHGFDLVPGPSLADVARESLAYLDARIERSGEIISDLLPLMSAVDPKDLPLVELFAERCLKEAYRAVDTVWGRWHQEFA